MLKILQANLNSTLLCAICYKHTIIIAQLAVFVIGRMQVFPANKRTNYRTKKR